MPYQSFSNLKYRISVLTYELSNSQVTLPSLATPYLWRCCIYFFLIRSLFQGQKITVSILRLTFPIITCTVPVGNAAQNHSNFWLLQPGVSSKKQLPKFPFLSILNWGTYCVFGIHFLQLRKNSGKQTIERLTFLSNAIQCSQPTKLKYREEQSIVGVVYYHKRL